MRFDPHARHGHGAERAGRAGRGFTRRRQHPDGPSGGVRVEPTGEKGPDGEQLALVKKALFTPLREHFVVKVKDGPDLEVHGNLLDHEYTIGEGRTKVAEVSKKYFHVRDSYSVSIEPGQDDMIILAVVVCIDEMTHAGN